MARFTIKDAGGESGSSQRPRSFVIKSPLPGTTPAAGASPIGPADQVRRSLQALITRTDAGARSQIRRPVFYYQNNGQVTAESARTGILDVLTGAWRDTIGQLSRTTTTAAYVVALEETVRFSDDFVLHDRVAQRDFKLRVGLDAWVHNATESIKALVKAAHESGGIDIHFRQLITRLLTSLDEGTSDNSLLDIILDSREMVVRKLREALQANGIEVDRVTVVLLVPFEATREIVENRGSLAIRVQGSESRTEIGYKLELIRDAGQRRRFYFNQLPLHGPGNTIAAELQNQIVRFLDSRYARDDFKRSVSRIESEVSRELNLAFPQRFGLRINNLEIFDRSPEIEDMLFDFQDQHRIIGTSRMLVIEHRGVIRCVDTGKAAAVDPAAFRNNVINWIKLETNKYLQGKTLADVVEIFCSNEEQEENRIRDYLGQQINAKARPYGFVVAPIIAVSQNIPERELVTGREFTVPAHEYALSLPNSKTELEIYALLRLSQPLQLRPYLKDEINLDEIVAARIRGFLARELQTVAPDDFYKSDIANHGGESRLRQDWTGKLSRELEGAFGLAVEELRFGRGRDPIRERFSRLLNATETLQFNRVLTATDGNPRQLGFIVQYHVLGVSKESWGRFQSKALLTASETEQLAEIRQRIEAIYDFRIQPQPKFDTWQPLFFAQHLRESMRQVLEDTIAREFGLVIEVPVDGIFTVDVEPARDPYLISLHEARERLELDKVKLISRNPEAADDWGSLEEDLKNIDNRIAMLDKQIDRAHAQYTERQLKVMSFEQERHALLANPVLAIPSALPAPSAVPDVGEDGSQSGTDRSQHG
jgi:hypothetical protein